MVPVPVSSITATSPADRVPAQRSQSRRILWRSLSGPTPLDLAECPPPSMGCRDGSQLAAFSARKESFPRVARWTAFPSLRELALRRMKSGEWLAALTPQTRFRASLVAERTQPHG